MATVKLYGILRTYTNAPQLQIPGGSIRSVVLKLCEGNTALCNAMLEGGNIRPHFKITLNGRDIQLTSGLDTLVGENDQIAFFSPIAGG
jgi:molybdopterin converting factor small subunit